METLLSVENDAAVVVKESLRRPGLRPDSREIKVL